MVETASARPPARSPARYPSRQSAALPPLRRESLRREPRRARRHPPPRRPPPRSAPDSAAPAGLALRPRPPPQKLLRTRFSLAELPAPLPPPRAAPPLPAPRVHPEFLAVARISKIPPPCARYF